MIVFTALGEGLRQGALMLWETFWALVLGFAFSGAVQAFVSRGAMDRALGPEARGRLGRATFLGMVSSSCSYAASAMAKSLVSRGADFTAAMVFMIASTNLVLELGVVLALLLGWQFTASEYLGGLLMIAGFALLSRFVLPRELVEQARSRLQRVDGDSGGAAPGGGRPPSLRSLEGWTQAASYAIGDITMLRRELLIGFGAAGLLAALLPSSVWGAVFLSGHGPWTALENALIGPLIAILSFVCSIGNVPLAAALWKGGISFGGVVSFVFADLITLPLLLIYRKFYGGRLTLWLLGSFWLVMSLTGLVVGAVFGLVHLVPQSRPTQVVSQSFGWDYTSYLDLVFLVVLACLYLLSRRARGLPTSAGLATDPVCGMRVRMGEAPAQAEVGGVRYWFCSDRCRGRFLKSLSLDRGGAAAHSGPAPATDPVCGMQVQPGADAPSRAVAGRDYWFCCEGCADTFAADPGAYLDRPVASH
ncbi:MAG: permease [Candidatus Dormibacteria bacterium]